LDLRFGPSLPITPAPLPSHHGSFPLHHLGLAAPSD
jgi:hypothetical protein